MLRLLSLLQSKRAWQGTELAGLLGVTGRTVRRDVGRLRELGYPVEGTTGVAGGYRLASGTALPPLLFDDEEAVAVAAALTAAGGTVTGIEQSSARALAKLEQVLPTRLHHRVSAVGATSATALRGGRPQVDPMVLAVLAAACRDREIVTISYRAYDAETTEHSVEPHHLLTGHHRWYLIGYDLNGADWRLFRLDGLTEPASTGRGFPPRELPAPNPAAYVTESLTAAPHRYTVDATVGASAESVHAVLCGPLGGIQALDDDSCAVRLTADSLEDITFDVLAMTAAAVPFTVEAPDEVRKHLIDVAENLARAVAG